MKEKSDVTKTAKESQNLGQIPSGSSNSNSGPMLELLMVPSASQCLAAAYSPVRGNFSLGNRISHCWQVLTVRKFFLTLGQDILSGNSSSLLPALVLHLGFYYF